MQCAQHIVTLKPSAVELVDRTMIELARSNPAFQPVIEAALIGEPEAILLVEFSDENTRQRLDQLVTLIADLGLPDQVVRITDASSQKALWEVRKAGLNIMMSMRGDGKPVSFIEDCAVPLEHLADYVARLTEVFRKHGTRGTWYAHASVGTLHAPILDMRQTGADSGAKKMRLIAEEAALMVRGYKGAFSGEHGDGLVRSEWVAWQFGPRLTRAFEQIKSLFDPDGLMNPGKIVKPTKMDDARLFRYPPGYRIQPLQTALDWSAWDVQNDPATEALTAPARRRSRARLRQGRRDVQQQRPLSQVRRRHHVPKFSRDARRRTPDARAREHAAAGFVRATRWRPRIGCRARRARPVRQLQRLSPRMPDRCRYGEDEDRVSSSLSRGVSIKDRLISYLPRAHWGARLPWLFNLRNTMPAATALSEKWFGFAAQRSLSWRSDISRRSDVSDQRRRQHRAAVARRCRRSRAVRRHIQQRLRARGCARCSRCSKLPATRCIALPADGSRRPLCCGRTFLATGLVDQAKIEARHVGSADAARRARRNCRWLRAVLPAVDARRVPGNGFGEAAQRLASSALLIEEFPRASIAPES